MTTALTLSLFFLSAVLTSMLSATVGMAGGTVLLSFLNFFYGFREMIPLHAATQLVSNAARTWYLREHVQKKLFFKFIAGSIFGVALGTYLLSRISSDLVPSLLIATFILYELLKPKKLPSVHVSENGFILVGVLIGTLSMFAGATGLLLGIFILGLKASKEETIALQAAMQTFNHAAKLVGFVYLGWRMENQFLPFVVLSVGAVLGTRFGVILLEKIPAKLFFWIFRAVLLASAIKILVSAGLAFLH